MGPSSFLKRSRKYLQPPNGTGLRTSKTPKTSPSSATSTAYPSTRKLRSPSRSTADGSSNSSTTQTRSPAPQREVGLISALSPPVLSYSTHTAKFKFKVKVKVKPPPQHSHPSCPILVVRGRRWGSKSERSKQTDRTKSTERPIHGVGVGQQMNSKMQIREKDGDRAVGRSIRSRSCIAHHIRMWQVTVIAKTTMAEVRPRSWPVGADRESRLEGYEYKMDMSDKKKLLIDTCSTTSSISSSGLPPSEDLSCGNAGSPSPWSPQTPDLRPHLSPPLSNDLPSQDPTSNKSASDSPSKPSHNE
jgi:hypothetical protein